MWKSSAFGPGDGYDKKPVQEIRETVQHQTVDHMWLRSWPMKGYRKLRPQNITLGFY